MGHSAQEKKEMLLSVLCAQYREHLVSDGRLTKTTRQNYVCRVDRFAEFAGTQATVSDLNRNLVSRYLHTVAKAHPTAAKMHLSALRNFCQYLKTEGWLRTVPTEGIALPKCPRPRRESVPDDTVTKLLNACDRLPQSEYRRVLAKALFSLLVYGAMRRSEVLGLRIEDVHLDTGEIFIREGKGRKSRPIYVCKECTDAVRAYLKQRPKDCQHDALLATNRFYGLGYDGFYSIIHDLHVVAGIPTGFKPHQFRHACASRLAANGAPLTAIQAMLGHSKLETTAIYLHSNAEQLKSIAHLASLTPTAPTQQKTASASGENREQKRFSIKRLRK